MIDSKTIAEKFDRDGYVLIEDIFPLEWIDRLRKEIDTILEHYDCSKACEAIFDPQCKDSRALEYFFQANDKVSCFLEKDAWDSEQKCLKVPRKFSVNFIGNALHRCNETFREFTFQECFQSLAKSLGLIDPLVILSSIIMKNPREDSVVPPHQNATFLYSTPEPRTVDFWIPLEDATENNGCLQFIPGSHRTHPLQTRWVRSKDLNGQTKMEYIGISTPDSLVVIDPKQLKMVPAKKGSCIVFSDLLVHCSGPNGTNQSRPAYIFNVFDQGREVEQIDGKDNKIIKQRERQWDPLNWMQPTDQFAFQHLYSF
ncbi:Phytanoyl-CoA dioxygenase domain-containing protein 1 -like protein [Sarcoptes scabiei]|uniref:Phytanoyl-CoA dioxygenase domain-containing protein 1 -like protein n=1 Tax=Sarcoptes scabiei TaxID=52283 RepID=A0A834RBH9_SARSC|nr:Phytanoyl-CoA dioxygenase domain-containing protein 1 -like protein [Sarcoptes scabiei]